MGQFSNVLLPIDKVHTVPQRATKGPALWTRFRWVKHGLWPAQQSQSLCLDYRWQVYQHPYQMYIYESARYPKVVKAAVANVNKGETDMSYKGELQTFIKQSKSHQICLSETCCTTISEFTIIMLMSRGRSNCGVTYYVGIYY